MAKFENKFSGKRVFITGADGFIGSHLAEALVQGGAKVTALALYNSFGSCGWLDEIADETRATIQLSCRVIKDRHAPCVRIEKPESLVAVGINLPMEHAVYDACNNMMEWFRDDYSISGKDMYIRMSCDPAFRVRTYQMVRAATIQHVVGAEYPKERLVPAM